MSKKKPWSYKAGSRPNTVVVYERTPGGVIQYRVWDPSTESFIRRSLGHRDREEAETWADETAIALRKESLDLALGRVTLGRVFDEYRKHRTPKKKPGSQKVDKRQIKLWIRFLKSDTDPHDIRLADWERFAAMRASGEIDAKGTAGGVDDRRKVRARVVQKDLEFLRSVLKWASAWRLENGKYLMRENPVRGFESPKELNPRRPIASDERFASVMWAAEDVVMAVRRGDRREFKRSYLPELLTIVAGTGRRISSVVALRYDDIIPRSADAPFGALRWRADSDKMGYEGAVPIGPDVRKAISTILEHRPGAGAAPLFPAPSDPSMSMRKDVADKWLKRAELYSGVEHLKGGLWHPYRRRWATRRSISRRTT